MCVDYSNIMWTPGVCYGLANITLNEGTYRPISEPLRACEEISPTVRGLLIGMFLLAIIRILLQLVWYRRCNAKRDQGMICGSNRKHSLRTCACACAWCVSYRRIGVLLGDNNRFKPRTTVTMTDVARVHVAPTQERRVSIFG